MPMENSVSHPQSFLVRCAGVKYLDDCPLERRVPVYLLVGGCFLALKLLCMLWKNLQLRRYDNMDAFYDRCGSPWPSGLWLLLEDVESMSMAARLAVYFGCVCGGEVCM